MAILLLKTPTISNHDYITHEDSNGMNIPSPQNLLRRPRWSEPTIIQSGPGPPVDTFPPTEKSSSLQSNVWSFGSIFKSPILGFYAFHPIPKVQTAKLPFITSIPDFFGAQLLNDFSWFT